MDFLKAVAEDLYSRYNHNISSLTLVFPSKRTQLFFSEILTSLIDTPLWSPDFMSLDEVMSSFTKLKKVDDFTLLMILYEVYKKHTKSQESFDKFYFWGETLLNDFNDIDRYLVKPHLIFKNLKEQKELEGDFSFLTDEQISQIQQFWNSFDPLGKSSLQDKFIEVWDVLLPVYNEFKEKLAQENKAYPGMIYRSVVESIKSSELQEISNKYIFIGFNAIDECELTLFSHLRKQDKAEFYWDYDEYYIKDKKQEAGRFLRRNIEMFPAPATFSLQSKLATGKDIHIISASSDVLQAKAIPKLLAEMNASFDKRTAVVLTDESLLIPVLHSLPEDCTDINITLGYPLLQTPVFTLAELLIRLQNSYNEDNKGFYYKDVLLILKHSYISVFAPQDVKQLTASIIDSNMVYVENSFFADNAFLSGIFTPLSGYRELTDYLIGIFSEIANTPAKESEQLSLRKEYIFYITKSLNKLKNSIEDIHLDIGKSVFLSLIRDVFRGLKIPFSGEPIKGLQVIGIHETRALDFENIIVLSVNEGRLPTEISKLTYIPHNLRRGYGLPCPEHFDAISAYNFYRLLQRTKKARLIYSSKNSDNRTGEMSRYLYQLKFESGFDIQEYPVTYNINFEEVKPIVVEKNEAIMQSLMGYIGDNATKSLSPSALCSYISCPLKFYFSKIAGFKQDEVVAEELPLNILGNIIHRVMEEIYLPMKGKVANENDINSLYTNHEYVDSLINLYFAKEFYKKDKLPKDLNENGKLLVTLDVIRKYVRGILKYDKENAGFTPLGFEERVKMVYNVGGLEINLSGIVDRIDRNNGNIRIVDYKTGAGRGRGKRMKFYGVESLFERNPDRRNKEAFQTFLYSMIYKESKQINETLTPALYFVRDCYSSHFTYLLKDDARYEKSEALKKVTDFSYYEDDFKVNLAQFLQGLFNPKVPFVQTEFEKTCKNCPYNTICGKALKN